MAELSTILALNAAIELGRQGYSCFPCQADKKPFPGSHGCDDASNVEDDVRRLWARYPGPLIGVACGPPSQICVVDIDRKPEALEWWATHKGQLLPTRAHRTRSGGIHLLYGNYDELRNSASKVAPGIDIRGDGGYIVWWPAAGCPVLSDAQCAPWPTFLEWLVALPEPKRQPLARSRGSSPHERLSRVAGLIKAVLHAPEGNRNSCLFWAACKVVEMAAELGPDYAEAVADLHDAARDVGLPDREITITIKSAQRRAAS
jgi:hypothetical protein